jgi:hypothetical protein
MKNLDLLVNAMWLQTLEELHDHNNPKYHNPKHYHHRQQKLTSEALCLKKLETKIKNYYVKTSN